MRQLASLILALTLAACSTLPDIAEPPQPPGAEAKYPAFVPIGRVVMDQAEAEAAATQTEEALAARLSGLRARAARLRSTETP